MFRLLLFITTLTSTTAFGKVGIYLATYSLCEVSHYDNMGSTTDYLYREFDEVVAGNLNRPYLEFWSKRDEVNYWVRKPTAEPKYSRRQIGPQQYLICIRISKQ